MSLILLILFLCAFTRGCDLSYGIRPPANNCKPDVIDNTVALEGGCGDSYFTELPPFNVNPSNNVTCCCDDSVLTCVGIWLDAETSILFGRDPINWYGTLDLRCETDLYNPQHYLNFSSIWSQSAPFIVHGAFCPCNQAIDLSITNRDLNTDTKFVYLISQEEGNVFEGSFVLGGADHTIDQAATNGSCGYWCPETPPCTVSTKEVEDVNSTVVLNLEWEGKRTIATGRLCLNGQYQVLVILAVMLPLLGAGIAIFVCIKRRRSVEEEERIEEMSGMGEAASRYKSMAAPPDLGQAEAPGPDSTYNPSLYSE